MSILWIKIVAMITMLIDHVGAFTPFEGWEYCRMIGRISFPLYAFMLVQGFLHTRSRWKYLVRMLVLALITQPIYTYCFYADAWRWDELNILFTLSTGLCGMWLLELAKRTLQKRNVRGAIQGLLLCLAAGVTVIAAELLSLDYGWEGVLLILLLYATANFKWACIPIVTLFAMRYQLQTGVWNEPVYSRSLFSVVSILPMLLYNGKPGPKPKSKWGAVLYKYGFYAFYPLHLLVLALIFR